MYSGMNIKRISKLVLVQIKMKKPLIIPCLDFSGKENSVSAMETTKGT